MLICVYVYLCVLTCVYVYLCVWQCVCVRLNAVSYLRWRITTLRYIRLQQPRYYAVIDHSRAASNDQVVVVIFFVRTFRALVCVVVRLTYCIHACVCGLWAFRPIVLFSLLIFVSLAINPNTWKINKLRIRHTEACSALMQRLALSLAECLTAAALRKCLRNRLEIGGVCKKQTQQQPFVYNSRLYYSRRSGKNQTQTIAFAFAK